MLLAGLTALSAAVPDNVAAHQINIYAAVEGRTIRGKVYFRGNAPAQNVAVRATDPAGNELGHTTTDEQGKFTLRAAGRVEHRLVADAGDGHATEPYVLPAELFPDAPAGGEQPADPSMVERSAAASPPAGPSLAPSCDEIAQIKQLNEQIDALQEELAACKSQVRIRDVLGGLGWIVGLGGIAYYYLGVRRRRARN